MASRDRFAAGRTALLERTRRAFQETFEAPEWPPLPKEEGLTAEALERVELAPRATCRECGAWVPIRVCGHLVLTVRFWPPGRVVQSVICPNRRCGAPVDVDAAAVVRARKVAPRGRRR